MDILGINIREINPQEIISSDEWKVALFISYYSQNSDMLDDYHFLRQFKNGHWFHKTGYRSFPNNLDDNQNIITDPEKCYLKKKQYDSCYCLSLRK